MYVPLLGIDLLFSFYPGHSSNTAASFQPRPPNTFTSSNGNHSATAASELPLLTGEDLKILDAFDQVGGENQFNSQMVYQQQAAVNGHGSVTI